MSNNNQNNHKVWNRSLDDIMSESFGKYAKYIIQDRALPDIRDGLKPVQRRILYAMSELKINFDKPYKKSARTVGEVIGKFHPHGDSSIYEAMVRMAQEWKNNIPLLDMQGNKGSIDGDGPAAMRYTECRLSKYGQYMMEDIDKNTVKFIPNFDDSEKEPSVLPSLLPNILINGATGIAAGYATNIPPFNFNEVIDGIIYKINNPDAPLASLVKIIKGPDFPTGGIIQGTKGIEDIFKTGKGKFFIRAKIEEEITRSNKKTKRLIVKEIPYDTNKAAIVKSLDEIRVNNELPGFKEVRDDSDKSGISIVLEFETEKDLEIIKTFLFKKTQLQISYTANIVLIKNRKPVQAGLLEILDSFIFHANEIIIKAAKFDLEKALNRKEILEGLIKAISDIDVLVNLIKSSKSKDEAKTKIQDYFGVNERQSEAIVSLRLYVLTSYDTNKLKNEYNELLAFIADKESLIKSNEHRNSHIISILEEFKKELGTKRKSLIVDQVEELEIETADIVEEVKGTCIVTRDNYIKFIQDDKIEEFELSKSKIKDSDIPIDIFKMSTLDHLVCLTNKGKCITIPAYKIKMTKLRENGIHINDLVTIDSFEKTLCAFAVKKTSNVNTEILVATKNSLIKRMLLQDLNLTKNAKVSSYINLKNGDEVANACLLNQDCNEVIAITENGFATRYMLSEIPIVGRTASGVKNMTLKVRDLIATTIPVPKDESFILITSNRGGKRIHINDIVQTTRSKTGKKIFQQVESNPYVVNWASIVSGRSTIYVLSDNNQLIETKVSEIPISDTSSRMNSFSKIEGNIIKGSCLDINKNIIETSLENNFLTLASLKEKSKNLDESKKDNNLSNQTKDYIDEKEDNIVQTFDNNDVLENDDNDQNTLFNLDENKFLASSNKDDNFNKKHNQSSNYNQNNESDYNDDFLKEEILKNVEKLKDNPIEKDVEQFPRAYDENTSDDLENNKIIKQNPDFEINKKQTNNEDIEINKENSIDETIESFPQYNNQTFVEDDDNDDNENNDLDESNNQEEDFSSLNNDIKYDFDDNQKNNNQNQSQENDVYSDDYLNDDDEEKQDRNDIDDVIYNEDITDQKELDDDSLNDDIEVKHFNAQTTKKYLDDISETFNLNNEIDIDSLNKQYNELESYENNESNNATDNNDMLSKPIQNNDVKNTMLDYENHDLNNLNESFKNNDQQQNETKNDDDIKTNKENKETTESFSNNFLNTTEISVDSINEMEEFEDFNINVNDEINDDNDYGDEDYFEE